MLLQAYKNFNPGNIIVIPEGKVSGKIQYNYDKTKYKVIENSNYTFIYKGFWYPDSKHKINDLINILLSNKRKNLHLFKGRFAGILVLKRENIVITFTDKLGMYDIFYYFSNGKLIISDNYYKLLSLVGYNSKDIDQVAVAEFLIFQYPLLDRTFSNKIKLLPYASCAEFNLTNNKLHLDKYWRYLQKPISHTDLTSSFTELDRLLNQSITRIKSINKSKKYTLGLSGGFDSRLVLKYALKNGIRPNCFTFGSAGSDAFEIAEIIASELEVKHENIEIGEEYWDYNLTHMYHNPMVSIMTSSYGPASEYIGYNTRILSGFYGGELFGNHIFKNFSKYVNNKINGIDYVSSDVKREIKKDFDYYMNFDSYSGSQIFDYENRQLRFIKNSPSFHFYKDFEINSPFIDYDVIDHVLSIPIQQLYKKYYYIRFLQAFHQDLLRVRAERSYENLSERYLFINSVRRMIIKGQIGIRNRFGISIKHLPSVVYLGAMNWRELINYVPPEVRNRKVHFDGIYTDKIVKKTNPVLKFNYITLVKYYEMLNKLNK